MNLSVQGRNDSGILGCSFFIKRNEKKQVIALKTPADTNTPSNARHRPAHAHAHEHRHEQKEQAHALRKAYRTARNSLPQYRQRKHARQVANRLKRNHAFKRAKTIASYLSSDGEVDTQPIHQQIWRAGKALYLPTTTAQNTLKFSPCTRSTALETGQWGIKQPRYSKLRARHLVPDLLLVPLVAFDSKGNRLGRGGGFYDRYLARLNKRSNRRRGGCCVDVIGIAHDAQKHRALPAKSWDAPMDTVVTERGVYTAK